VNSAKHHVKGFPSYDARDGLGYGILEPSGFDQPRAFNQYAEPVEEDLEAADSIDDKTYTAVLDRLLKYTPSDPYAKYGNDPFHFVDGSTKLSELSTAKGMVPFPRMYHGKQAVAGGTAQRLPAGPTLTFRTRIRPTGTKKGFSEPPQPVDDIQDVTGPKYELEDIVNADPDAEHLNRIKSLIKLIHQEQEHNQ